MHPIQLRVQNYLERSNSEVVGMPFEVVETAVKEFRKLLNRRFNRGPGQNQNFNLSMSKVGRPTCQLQMEKAGAPREALPYNFAMQMLLGDTMEILAVAIMKAAGVNIEATQQKCEIDVNGEVIFGRDDVEIDGEVWDIKSCSPWSFNNKFKRGFNAVAQEDSFGYVCQGYGYAEGRGMPFGGWICLEKSTGEWEVCPAHPDQEVHDKAIEEIRETVDMITSDKPFERCFTDEAEVFRKKETGNRILCKTCEFCSFKYSCWPGLQHKPQIASDAKHPKWVYYTHIEENTADGEQNS